MGIYVVEFTPFMEDFCLQFAAYETEEDAEKCAKEFTKKTKLKAWVTFYLFGEEFYHD